jgi:hypothetical protein
VELGLTADEWLALTPAEEDALWVAWRKKEDREDRRWARLTYFAYLALPLKRHEREMDDFLLFKPVVVPKTAAELWLGWDIYCTATAAKSPPPVAA